MHYEINVSLNGKHYFATAERSLTNMDTAYLAYAQFLELFPYKDGYRVRLAHIKTIKTYLEGSP